MKPTFTIRKNFHYQNLLILCLLLAGTVSGFSKGTNDLRYNPYLRSQTITPSYLERYKEGLRTLYSLERIIAGYRNTADNAGTSVYAKAVSAESRTEDPCYSEVFKYCAGQEIEIDIEAEAGYQNYKWFKDNVEIAGATGSTYTITAPGLYHFTAEDPQTCEGKLCCPYLVTQEPAFDAVIVKTDAACATGTSGSITVTPSVGQITDYTYSLDGAPFQASNIFTGLAGGTYKVTVKSAKGCSIEKTVEIAQPGGILAKAEAVCKDNKTTATILASGGVEPYTYSLDGGAFGAESVFADLAQGQHEVVVKDANGCTYKVTVDAFCECTPEIFEYCPGEVIEILAEAAPGQATYQWYKDGKPIDGATAATYTITSIGSYHYTSGGDDTCEGELCCPIIVREKDAPAVQLADAALSCTTTSAQLTATSDPANTFSWTGPDGFTGNTAVVTVNKPGEYIVTVTGVNGCITKDTAVVTQDAQLPTVTVNDGELNCEKKSVEIKATSSAGVTYSWAGPGGFTATTETITATAAGDYIVTVTSVNGCIAKDTAVVTQNSDLPTVTVSLKEGELTCDTQTLDITATASAGATYSWAGPGGFTATTAGISVTEPGKYIVTVTSGNGCTAKDTSVITLVKTTPFLAATPSCVDNKGKVTLVASSGKAPYSYSKDGVTFQAEAVFTGLINGNYVFTVKDANGCIATVTAVVKCEIECVPQIYRFCENEAISVTIEAEEGLANYQWYRNGEAIAGATASVYEATEPGKYYYTAGTGDQCDGILCCPIEIFRYPGFIATAIPGKVDCAVGPVVPVTIHVNGGTAPFSYSMDGITFVSGNMFMVAPGSHKFYVKDNNGCINETNTVVIPEIEMPKTPIVTTNKNMVCGTELATLTGACAVGEVVQWNNGMVGGTIQVGEGTYTAVCTNKCGSSPASAPITIIGKPVPGAPIVGTDKTEVCGKELAKLTANCTVGQVIEWSNGKYGSPIEVGVGIYTARCKNECGYSEDSRPITITNGKVPGSPEVGTDKSMVCGDEKATLGAECPVGSVVVWSNGQVGNMIQVGEGIYTAICRNDCGDSESSGHITINKGMVPKPPTIYPSKVFVCGDETAKLTATCEIGSTVHWSNGKEGNEISVGEGIYRAVCKNTCGTSDESLPVVIGKDKAPEPPTIATNKTTVCGEEKAELGAHCASGGIILWSNGMAGSPIEVGAGTYTAKCSTACGISVASVPVTITTGGAPDKPIVTAVSTTVCGDEKVKLTAFCASGTVSWVGVTGFNPTVYVGTGIYAAKCNTSCGASLASEPVVITPGTTPSKPIISATITSVCGDEKATLTGTCPKGGELVWSNGASGSPIQVGVGFYTARCVNDCGTSPASDMISIEPGQKPGRPSIKAHQTSVCGDEKAMLTGTCTSGVLTWSNAMTGSPIYVGPGTYFATCVNACGASATSTSVTITTGQLPGKPVISTDKQVVCGNEKATLSGICPAGSTLKWSNGMTGAQIEVGVGTYYANCVSECGTSVNSETIVINTQPGPGKPNIQANKQTVCGDEKAVLTGSCPSGGTLTWSNGSTGSPISVGAGTYFATCVSSCGTSVASEPITIGTGSTPTAPTVVPSKTTLCGAETATLTATCTTGTVLWSDGTTANPRTVGAGTYTATCVNACGSSPASTPVVITTQPAPGKPNIQTNKLMVCGAEKATLTGACPSGGILTWSNGATGSPISVGAGTYTATCVSSCGTSVASEPITIGTGNTPAAPTVVPSKTTLCGAETATLTATCATGTVQWSDGTTANPRTVGAGTYTATCVNACGSSPASTPVVITTQPAPGKPNIQTNKLMVCGDEKAALTGACPSGGILTWSNGATGSPISVGAGTYFATCVSSCGTSVASEPITIGTGNTPAAPTVVPSKTTLCGAETATLTATCATGTVLWSDGTTANPRTVGAGTYTATCVNACGSSPASTPVVITTQPAPGKPSIQANKLTVCGDEKAALTGACPSGGILTWSNGATGSPISVGAGTYTATCVSSCGTSVASEPITIGTGNTPPAPTVVPSKTTLCGAETATLTATCATGTVQWSDGTTANPRTVGAGTYTATCVNACGSSPASTPVVITTQPAPGKPSIQANKLTVCGDEKATLTGSCPSGGILTWSNGATGSPISVGAGTYTATCVSSCGTSVASEPITIGTGSTPTAPTVVPSKTTLCGAETATLTATCATGTVLWSDGTTANPRTVGAGTYTATCVNACGSSPASTPVVITTQPAPGKPSIQANKHTVCGDEKVVLTGSCPSGGILTWSNGSTGSPISVGAGTYTATCVSSCGTSVASEPITIGTGSTPTAPTVVPSKTTLCGAETATLTATCATGTVLWSDGTTANPRTVGAGTYTATCVNACGSSPASTPVVITTQPAPGKPSIQANKLTVCGDEKAALTGSCPSGGILTWSNGSTGSPISVGAGTYTATCVSSCGTSVASEPITIGTGNTPAAPTVGPSKTTLCGAETATLIAACATGTVQWSDGTTANPRTVGAGTYTATCVNACGSSPASTPVVITTQPAPGKPSIQANKLTVCGDEKVTLAGSCPSGGILTWSNGATGRSISVGAGTYTATCVSSCGTSVASEPITIGRGSTPVAPSVATNTNAICGTDKATLSAVCASGTIVWSNGATGSSIQVGAGTYTATCKTDCGTSPASTPIVITQGNKPGAPAITASVTVVCDNETATMTATCATGTVLWSDGSTANPRKAGAGTYTATCVNACGGSPNSNTIVIDRGPVPSKPNIQTNRTSLCAGEKATLTGACPAGGTLTWSNGAKGSPISVGTGTYTATCVNACGASEVSAPVVIGDGAKPNAPDVTTNKSVLCGTETATLTATGCAGGTINWSNGGTGTTKVVTAGTYTATCVTSCGTSAASAPVTINQESAPANFTIATSTATVCGTEKATLTATGCEGGTVTWSTGATGASIQVGAGSYSATCKTNCGGTVSAGPLVINKENAPAAPVLTSDKTAVCGSEKATLTATGCTGTVIWYRPGTSGPDMVASGVTVLKIAAGTYTATCATTCGTSAASNPVTIGTSDKPAAPSVTADKPTVCEGEKATLTATGCAGTVTWSNGATGASIQVGAGTYTATCTTDCGTSQASLPVIIGTSVKPAAPSVSADKTTVCVGEQVTLTATGCTGTVTWSNGATGTSIQVGVGTYTATCTSACGTSSASAQVVIKTTDKPAAPSVSTDKTTVCDNEKATLTASGCAGIVTWSTGATGTSIQVGAGTYTATCTLGCGISDASAPVTIGTSAKPAAPSVSADKATVCDNEKATLTATGCAGTITWSTGQTVSVIQVGAGTYTATCTSGCGTSDASTPVTIGTSDKPAAPSVSADKGTVCDGEKATLTATGCTGTVTWSTGQTVSVIQVGVGTYTATCTTSCGTSAASTPVTIGTSDKPAAPSVSADKATVCEGEKATLTATRCAGTVTWSTGATGVSIQVGTGTYTATCTSSCGTSLASAPVTIGTSDKPAAPAVSADKGTVCDSEKATLTASGCAGTVTWSTSATGTSIQVGAGTYTATCTSSCGTSDASAPVTIGTSDKPAAPSVTADKATVCDSEMATLTASGCAGTVTWSTGTTGMSIQVGAGTYTATCTTGCGTSETSSPVTIGTSEKPAKPMITASGNSVCGVEKVTLTASGCSGTVNWSNGETGTSILVGAGTYTATCTTSCGTSDATAVSISEGGSPEPPVVTSDKGSICGSEKATLTATGCVGGVIRWSTGESGFQIQVGPGVYTATCTDACGNESIACIAVEIDNNATTPDTPAITASTDGVCGEELATLTATGCTGGTVIWSNGSQGHSIQVSVGTYTAICKTDCGESAASNSVTIQSKGGTLSISSDKTAYCAGETVTLTATGCTTGTIKWSNGATGSSITLPATASMTMTAVCSEGGGSVSTCDFAVGDVEFEYQTQQNPAGMNTRFLLTSNAYEILQVKTTPKFENVQEGTYKVISLVYIGDIQGLVAGANYSNLDKGSCYSDEETDISVCNPTNPGGNNCAAVGSIQVQVKTPAECGGNNGGEEDCKTAPTVTSSVGSATCVGTTVTLTALNCNAQVVWNTGATGASINFMPTATGAYKFSAKCVSSAAGCESEASQEITVNVVDALPKPTAIETLNNICPLAYVDLRNAILGAPTTGGTFEFHFENSPASPLVTSAQVTNGVYYLFERNTAGCYSVGTPVTVVISENCENPVHPTAVDVAIEKTGDKETAEVNDQVTYTVKVSNTGGNGVSDIKVRDIIPVGLQITEVSENAFLEEGVVRISLDTLAPGASVEVTYTGTVTAPGRIANKAELEAVAQNDTNQANNSSTWVINNVAQVDSLIGLAKAVGEITRREDLGANVYEVPFVFTITNMGLKDLDHVRLADTLSLTFGSADMVESIHLEADSGLTVNPNYTGSGEQTHLLIAEESAIAAGATLNVRLKVFVNMGDKASGSFANSATVYAGTVKEISDRSTDGVNPDPDGDGDPTNNSTDTEFNIGDSVPTYGIGAALAVVDSAFVNDKKAYEVTYRVLVRNYGADTLTGVFLTDTLATTFAGAPEFTVTGKPVVTSQGSSLVINPAFDGKTDFRLLLPDAAAILAPAQTDTVEFKVTVVFGENVGPYSTNVIAFGEDNGTMLTDTSNAGVEIVKHLSTPTVFSIPEDLDPRSMVTIPEGFSPNGDGVNDNWKINLKGNAKIEKLIIVNRYGSTLYEEDGETVTTSGWDGKANKGMIPGTGTVPTGTYYYKLKLVGQDKYIIDYITVER